MEGHWPASLRQGETHRAFFYRFWTFLDDFGTWHMVYGLKITHGDYSQNLMSFSASPRKLDQKLWFFFGSLLRSRHVKTHKKISTRFADFADPNIPYEPCPFRCSPANKIITFEYRFPIGWGLLNWAGKPGLRTGRLLSWMDQQLTIRDCTNKQSLVHFRIKL